MTSIAPIVIGCIDSLATEEFLHGCVSIDWNDLKCVRRRRRRRRPYLLSSHVSTLVLILCVE